MDIYTKLFITNWVCILFTMFVDQFLVGDKIGDNRYLGPALGMWALVSYISIPLIIIRSVWFL